MDHQHPCAICLGALPVKGSKTLTKNRYQTLSCGHSFHRRCVGKWFENAPTCPCCRIPVDTPGPSKRVDANVDTYIEFFQFDPRRGRVGVSEGYVSAPHQDTSLVTETVINLEELAERLAERLDERLRSRPLAGSAHQPLFSPFEAEARRDATTSWDDDD